MHHHRVAGANSIEHAKRLATRQHVILADDLEPVDRGIAVKNLVVVLGAQRKPKTEERRLGGLRRTVCTRSRRRIRQFACDVHAASTMDDIFYSNLAWKGGPAYTGPPAATQGGTRRA